MKLRVVPAAGPVLDLSSRGDAAALAARLEGVVVRSVTRDDVAAALERGGFPQESAAAKVQLFDQCDALRSRLGWAAPEHAWWIPGRLEVFGKHTDYAGGRTLVAALPRGFVVLAAAPGASSPGVKAADAADRRDRFESALGLTESSVRAGHTTSTRSCSGWHVTSLPRHSQRRSFLPATCHRRRA